MRRLWSRKPIGEHFEDNYIPEPNTGCWLWLRACNARGYGWLRFKGREELAHRVSAHLYLGFDLRDDLGVLHRCDVPSCVNPQHLFFGTPFVNHVDSQNKGRAKAALSGSTECAKGHPFDEKNTYWTKDGRHCRACDLGRDRSSYVRPKKPVFLNEPRPPWEK